MGQTIFLTQPGSALPLIRPNFSIRAAPWTPLILFKDSKTEDILSLI
ncbi:MAG: hypothetical protein GF316_09600 [Candidatus Lokiarchaeota archaeon]|nr:hypothetical protein [Candidatus Lokiarchaeota archaeon]